MIFHNEYGAEDDHRVSTANPTYEYYKGTLGIIAINHVKATFNYFTQLVSNFILLPLNSYIEYWFSKINLPILTEEYSTIIFSYSAKGIVGHCCDQVFFGNKSFFWTAYGMSTPPFVWIDTSIFLDKSGHGSFYDYYFFFGDIPDIIQFIHYTL